MNRRKFGGKTKKFDVKFTTLPSQKVPAKNILCIFGGKNSAENLTKTYGENHKTQKTDVFRRQNFSRQHFPAFFFSVAGGARKWRHGGHPVGVKMFHGGQGSRLMGVPLLEPAEFEELDGQ